MDRAEYKAKLENINMLAEDGHFSDAAKIADEIDWRHVKSVRTLSMIGEIYEADRQYDKSREILELAYRRSGTSSKTVLYRLAELDIRAGHYEDAKKFINEFEQISPNDTSRLLLKYKLLRARRAPYDDQIEVLKEYKDEEYSERWAYELAKVYKKNGQKDKCIEECDDMILWFSEGRYVRKALELKSSLTDLSPSQKSLYEKLLIPEDKVERNQAEPGPEPVDDEPDRQLNAIETVEKAVFEADNEEDDHRLKYTSEEAISQVDEGAAEGGESISGEPEEKEEPLASSDEEERDGEEAADGSDSIDAARALTEEHEDEEIDRSPLNELKELTEQAESEETFQMKVSNSFRNAWAGIKKSFSRKDKNSDENAPGNAAGAAVVTDVEAGEASVSGADEVAAAGAGEASVSGAGEAAAGAAGVGETSASGAGEAAAGAAGVGETSVSGAGEVVAAGVGETSVSDGGEAVAAGAGEASVSGADETAVGAAGAGEASVSGADTQADGSGEAGKDEFSGAIDSVEPAGETVGKSAETQESAGAEGSAESENAARTEDHANRPDSDAADEKKDSFDDFDLESLLAETAGSLASEVASGGYVLVDTLEDDRPAAEAEARRYRISRREAEKEKDEVELTGSLDLGDEEIPEDEVGDDPDDDIVITEEDLAVERNPVDESDSEDEELSADEMDAADELSAEASSADEMEAEDREEFSAEASTVDEPDAEDEELPEEISGEAVEEAATEIGESVDMPETVIPTSVSEAYRFAEEYDETEAYEEAEKYEDVCADAEGEVEELTDVESALADSAEEAAVDAEETDGLKETPETDAAAEMEVAQAEVAQAVREEGAEIADEVTYESSGTDFAENDAENEDETAAGTESGFSLRKEIEKLISGGWWKKKKKDSVEEADEEADEEAAESGEEAAEAEEVVETVETVEAAEADRFDENDAAKLDAAEENIEESEPVIEIPSEDVTVEDSEAEQVEDAEEIEDVEELEAAEEAEAVESAEVTEAAEAVESAEVTEAAEAVESAEVTEAAEAVESTEVTEAAEAVESTEVTEAAEAVESAEVTEEAEPVETLEAVEQADVIEMTEDTDSVEENDPDEVVFEAAPAADEDADIPDFEGDASGAGAFSEEENEEEIPEEASGEEIMNLTNEEISTEFSEAEIREHVVVTKEYINKIPVEGRSFTDTEKMIMSYFAQIPGIDLQVTSALADIHNNSGERTSKSGNVVIMGRQCSGKTRLAELLIQLACVDLGITAVKKAIVVADDFNAKSPEEVVKKMAGGFLVIEAAGSLDDKIIERLNRAMEYRTDALVVILEDEKDDLVKMLNKHPEFAEKFTSQIMVPIFTNDELVQFGSVCARDEGYCLDELATLALYTMIGENQKDAEPVTVGMVRTIIDRAISRHNRKFRFGKQERDGGYIVLHEKDFNF